MTTFSCKRRGFCPSCGARRMTESAVLRVDGVLPHQPMRQQVLSFLYPMRFLLAARPDVMGRVRTIAYLAIGTHLVGKARFKRAKAEARAVALIQHFGSAGG